MTRKIQIIAESPSLTARLAALALDQAGLDQAGLTEVVLVEKKPDENPPPLALALNPASLDFLASLGLKIPAAAAIDKVKIYGAKADKIYSPPFCVAGKDIERENLGLVVWQTDLLAALDTTPKQTNIEEDVFTIDTRANAYDGSPYRQMAVTTILTYKDYSHNNEAQQFFYKKGPLALLPLAKGQSFLIWTRPTKEAQKLLALPQEKFIAYLSAHLPKEQQNFSLAPPPAPAGSSSEVRAVPLHFHFAAKTFSENKLFIGAAAHRPHPLAGQGFNICVEDIRLLSQTIKTYQRLGLEIFSPQMLKEYTTARRAHAGTLVGMVDILARAPFLSNPFAAAALDFLNLSPMMRKTFAAAGAGLLHSFMASSINKTGTPSSTG